MPWTRSTPPEAPGVWTLSLPHSDPVLPCGLGTQNPISLLHLLNFSRWDSEMIRAPATSETISRLVWANTFLEPDAGFVTHPLPGMVSRVVLCPCVGLEFSDLWSHPSLTGHIWRPGWTYLGTLGSNLIKDTGPVHDS